MTLWMLPAFLLLIGLGVWQVQRLHWKLELIHTVETRMKAPAQSLDAVLAGPEGLANAEWRHVRISGHYLNDREVYLFAQGPDGAHGVQVITPFVRDAGGTILVNRGFVPNEKKDPTARAAGQIEGETSVTGVVRLSIKPGLFTPAPEPAQRLWFVKDAPDMAKAMGIMLAAPLFIEADAGANPGGLPIGGQTIVDFPNNHLQYAGTWFLLALTLLVVYLAYHRSQGRLGFGKRDSGRNKA
jgi:surfeit locus 1 family protein